MKDPGRILVDSGEFSALWATKCTGKTWNNHLFIHTLSRQINIERDSVALYSIV